MKKDIYIFGASNSGISSYEKLKRYYNVIGFLDNDNKKWGNRLEGLEIFSPKCLKSDDQIFIASMYYKQIAEQLEKINIKNYTMSPIFYINKKFSYSSIAKNKLYNKLIKLNVDDLNISDYNKRYLKEIINNLHWFLEIYEEILLALIFELNLDIGKSNFLDYGGGTGILSLFACELGFNKIFYNDIYDVSVRDAKVIAESLGYYLDDYISGDVNVLVNYSKDNGEYFNAIGCLDVLEHIYDLKEFFDKIIYTIDEKSAILMCSTANSYNEKIVKKLEKFHDELEYNDRKEEYGHKQIDTLKAYYKIRKEIIEKYLSSNNIQLDNEVINKLVIATKGLYKKDIISATLNFLKYKTLPQVEKKFPSNTCDPLSGNWGEHLIDFDKLISEIDNKAFKINIFEKENIQECDVISLFFKTNNLKDC